MDHEPWTMDHEPWTMDHEPWTMDHEPITRPDPFADLPTLCALHRQIGRLDPAGPPRLECVWPPALPAVRRLGVLAGSFNPLTVAHTALADAARLAARLDLVAFALASRTVDKERPTGAMLEDRLLTLRLYAEGQPGIGVIALNRGLYADQAELLRSTLAGVELLGLVVGFDKLVQILDPRYYDDRERALDRLFTNAVLLVAPRAGAGDAEIDALLSRPENRRYRPYVQPLPLPADLQAVSASDVRARVAAGHDVADLVPPVVARFIAQTGCYRPPVRIGGEDVDAHGLRCMLVQSLCALPTTPPLDLAAVLAAALADTAAGRALRRAIETLLPEALAALLAKRSDWSDVREG